LPRLVPSGSFFGHFLLTPIVEFCQPLHGCAQLRRRSPENLQCRAVFIQFDKNHGWPRRRGLQPVADSRSGRIALKALAPGAKVCRRAAVSNQFCGFDQPLRWLAATLPKFTSPAGWPGRETSVWDRSRRRGPRRARRLWPVCRPAPWWQSPCRFWPLCGRTIGGSAHRSA